RCTLLEIDPAFRKNGTHLPDPGAEGWERKPNERHGSQRERPRAPRFVPLSRAEATGCARWLAARQCPSVLVLESLRGVELEGALREPLRAARAGHHVGYLRRLSLLAG